MKYTVLKGKNTFTPVFPILPYFRNVLEFDLTVDSSWFGGNGLTSPLGFGCKTHAVGRFNYHTGGVNWAISNINGRVFLTPRYYTPISSGYYDLQEINAPVELFPNKPVRCRIELRGVTTFMVDNKVIHIAPVSIPNTWISQPFMGRSGNDNNYQAEPIPGAVAQRNFTMFITAR